MRFTQNYRLMSVVAGEVLDPLEDSRRFLTIDRQLLGLFEVFGNGIISGWNLSAGSGLSVSISPGQGHVSYFSASTVDVNTVTNLQPNAVNYIYATTREATRFDRIPLFGSSTNYYSGRVLLGTATTNASGVTSIDLTQRTDISFIEQIKTLINQHRHRGGGDNPTKIDLTQEVMGQLPGFKIQDIDASKITAGVISPARIPPLSHSDLLNSGVLTHAQLDSFVRGLQNPNIRLLGELGATNLLQLYLAFKHIWNEVDMFTSNMLVEIPGITPDSFTDFINTTAVVDKTNHLIQGVPSLGGQLVTTTFRTTQDFNASSYKSSIEVTSDDTGSLFKLTKPLTELVVESFDNVFATNTTIPDWTLETVASEDNTTFKSDSSKKVDGAYSVKLNVDEQVRVQATRVFSQSQNWTNYNELQTYVETLSAEHGKIMIQLLKKDSSNNLVEIDSFALLDTNETTVGFRKVIRDISTVDRTQVDAIRIYIDSALGWDLSTFIVNIDRIVLNNNLFFSPTGRIRFRLKTPQKSKWAAISWTSDAGGNILARARTAPSYETFDQSTSAPFSSFFSDSGGDPHVDDNRAIEVEIALSSGSGNTTSPVVRSITVSYIANSTASGITIDNTEEFLRASKLENASVVSPGEVVIDGRIDVDDVVYGMQHSIQQASVDTSGTASLFGTPVVGIDGSTLPLSPLQAAAGGTGLRTSNLDGVASVERLQDRTYLAADTLNDRIVIFDREGSALSVLGSNNVRNQKDLYPLTIAYNRTDKLLYICWSMNVSLASMDLTKIVLSGAGLSMTLSNTADKVVRIAGPKSESQTSNVSPILLSTAHAAILENFFGSTTTTDQRLFARIAPSAVKEGNNVANKNYGTLFTARGMPVFVGNIRYIAGIYRPVAVVRTSNDTWLVCNAKPLLTGSDNTDLITGVAAEEVTSLIEVDPATGLISFSDNSVDFSLVTLGAAAEYNDDYVVVAGIVEGEGPPQTTTANSITATVGGGVVSQSDTTTTTNTQGTSSATTASTVKTDIDILSSRRGVVKIIEKQSDRAVFSQETSDGTYAADVQVDEDNNLVVIEKSFSTTESQGRVIKLDEDGNVFFQFGMADMASPNDVRVLSTGNMVVST